MQVGRWGDSLALRLPASIVKRLGLREVDEVVVEIGADWAVCTARGQVRRQALKRLTRLDWSLPPGLEFRRDTGGFGED